MRNEYSSISEINPFISQYEYFKNTQLYKDLISLLTVFLRISCYPNFLYNKFILLNSDLGVLGKLLYDLKKEILLVSKYSEDFYFIHEELQDKFKLIDWQNNKIISLFFNPDVLIDYNFKVLDIPTLDYFIEFLNKNNNPKLFLIIDTHLGLDLIIEKFEKNRYEYLINEKNEIKNILLNKTKSFNLDNILIFKYIPLPIKKEYIGLD